jgi:hypothetical protein
VSHFQFCHSILPPPPKHQGRPRKWCNSACQTKAWRQAHAKQHSLDCQGCGSPLDQQRGTRGSLFKYHAGCQLVKRAWNRLEQDSARMARYHALKAAGAVYEVAVFGSAGEIRFEGAMAALKEEANA